MQTCGTLFAMLGSSRSTMSTIIYLLLNTPSDYLYTFVRVIPGIVIFPYGMKKLFGWFDGPGIRGSLEQLSRRGIPVVVAWLIIIGQSFGSAALILGCFSRVAACGLFIIFAGALTVHIPDGWELNWFGKKRGEGVEYFILLLSLLLVVLIEGGGSLSIDRFIMLKFFTAR